MNAPRPHGSQAELFPVPRGLRAPSAGAQKAPCQPQRQHRSGERRARDPRDLDTTKDSILAAVARWNEDRRDAFEERAAIIEFDGGETRDVAERIAFELYRREVAS